MNPLNLLNHREAVCFFKTSSCGTIERIERIFLQKVKKIKGNAWMFLGNYISLPPK